MKKFYKDYNEFDWYLITPYQGEIIRGPGIVKANGELEINEYKEIHGGCCHAYIPSNWESWSICISSISIPIQVKGEHIIAAGTQDDMCFFEYEITQETWDKYVLNDK